MTETETAFVYLSAPGLRIADRCAERKAEIPVDLLCCCFGAAIRGPIGCTCWEPEYDLEQDSPRPGPQVVRIHPCCDCAYSSDSPEQQTIDGAEHLDELAAAREPFWWHQGMRRVRRWRHPSGRVVQGTADEYAPPKVDGIPFKADGSPAELCSGWAAARFQGGS